VGVRGEKKRSTIRGVLEDKKSAFWGGGGGGGGGGGDVEKKSLLRFPLPTRRQGGLERDNGSLGEVCIREGKHPRKTGKEQKKKKKSMGALII